MSGVMGWMVARWRNVIGMEPSMRPPLLQCNWLCSNHFNRSQWVNWYISNAPNYLLLRSSQFHVLLKIGIWYKAHPWKSLQEPSNTLSREYCWVCAANWYLFHLCFFGQERIMPHKGEGKIRDSKSSIWEPNWITNRNLQRNSMYSLPPKLYSCRFGRIHSLYRLR